MFSPDNMFMKTPEGHEKVLYWGLEVKSDSGTLLSPEVCLTRRSLPGIAEHDVTKWCGEAGIYCVKVFCKELNPTIERNHHKIAALCMFLYTTHRDCFLHSRRQLFGF